MSKLIFFPVEEILILGIVLFVLGFFFTQYVFIYVKQCILILVEKNLLYK